MVTPKYIAFSNPQDTRQGPVNRLCFGWLTLTSSIHDKFNATGYEINLDNVMNLFYTILNSTYIFRCKSSTFYSEEHQRRMIRPLVCSPARLLSFRLPTIARCIDFCRRARIAFAPISLLPWSTEFVRYSVIHFCTCYWCVVINPFFIDKLIRKCIRFANECYISM